MLSECLSGRHSPKSGTLHFEGRFSSKTAAKLSEWAGCSLDLAVGGGRNGVLTVGSLDWRPHHCPGTRRKRKFEALQNQGLWGAPALSRALQWSLNFESLWAASSWSGESARHLGEERSQGAFPFTPAVEGRVGITPVSRACLRITATEAGHVGL